MHVYHVNVHHQTRGGWFGYLGGTALLFVTVFWQLGSPTFWDPDEAHYAETTRELITSGDWLAPTFNGQPFFDKPVLFHWLQAVPMRLLNDPEWAARLIPAIACVFLVVLTWWLGSTLGTREEGRLAALIVALNPGVFGLARYAILDAVFALFLFGGISLVAVSALRDRPQLQYPGYVLIGLAVFTKGPVALVLCAGALCLVAAVSTDVRQRFFRLRLGVGLVIVAGVAAPWFVYMTIRFGRDFITGYFLQENLLLFARAPYRNQPPWYFYPEIITLGFLPWTALIAGSLWDTTRTRPRQLQNVDLLLWGWTVAVVGLFSASSFKLDHYIFPVTPALALICARAWNATPHREGGPSRGTRTGKMLVGPTCAVLGIVLAAVVVAFGLRRALLTPAAGLVAAGVATTVRRRQSGSVPTAILGSLGLLYAAVIVWVIPDIDRLKVIPEVAAWVAHEAHPADRVASYRLNRWTSAFRFYVDRPVALLDGDDETRKFFVDDSAFFCVMTRDAYDQLRKAGVSMKIAHSREGLWATSGDVLRPDRFRTTEFVVAVSASGEHRHAASRRPRD
jgi:4-amino-4-deoxy-L-arabinose transferase-like glycosyltransferase